MRMAQDFTFGFRVEMRDHGSTFSPLKGDAAKWASALLQRLA